MPVIECPICQSEITIEVITKRCPSTLPGAPHLDWKQMPPQIQEFWAHIEQAVAAGKNLEDYSLDLLREALVEREV